MGQYSWFTVYKIRKPDYILKFVCLFHTMKLFSIETLKADFHNKCESRETKDFNIKKQDYFWVGLKMDYIQRLENEMCRTDAYESEYIAKCLRYAEKLLDSELPVLFDRKHVNKVLKMWQLKFPCYSSFYIKGKRKYREIMAPSLKLKRRQRWILENILEKIPLSQYCHGFVRGRSIVTNARGHIGKARILTMDIQDFFPSIKEEQVREVFQSAGYSLSAAERLTEICCFQGKLPQGAPSSPYLANLFCRELDEELGEIARKYELIYTRYADDMTFSGDKELEFLIPLVEDMLRKYGFSINEEKTRIGNNHKMVTGLLLEENTMKIPKHFKRKLKQEIYYCKKYGVFSHLQNTGETNRVNFREYLYGKAYYIKMVEPKTGEKFLKDLDSIQW